MSLDDELNKLDEEHARKRADLQREFYIRAKVLADTSEYHPAFIHVGKLYGSVGQVSFKGTEYESLRKGKQPDVTLLKQLLTNHPPVPRVKVRDGSLSFRPATQDWK